MDPATGSVSVFGKTNIETVHIIAGQFLTVWMDGVQIELRMTPRGNREIYIAEGEVKVAPFSEWKEE